MSDRKFDADEISSWCVEFVADMLGRAPAEIDPRAKFGRIGFDSAMSVQLIVAVESWLGVRLEPDVVHNHPTIASLAAHVCRLCEAGTPEPRK